MDEKLNARKMALQAKHSGRPFAVFLEKTQAAFFVEDSNDVILKGQNVILNGWKECFDAGILLW